MIVAKKTTTKSHKNEMHFNAGLQRLNMALLLIFIVVVTCTSLWFQVNLGGLLFSQQQQQESHLLRLTERITVSLAKERYLFYDLYRGRFGNQIIQMEWAYRLAHVTNRTLVIMPPRKEYQFIGMPIALGENYSIWNLDLLLNKSPVKLHFHPSVNWTGPTPHANCTWTEREGKFVVTWAMQRNKLRECEEILYLRTRKGLVTPYRSDTREFGVDPLLFWKHVQFNQHVFAYADQLLHELLPTNKLMIGLHARTFRETGTTQEQVISRVCGPTMRDVPKQINYILHSRRKCQCEMKNAINPETGKNWADGGLGQYWEKIHMLKTCDLSSPTNISALLGHHTEDLLKQRFFAATDHHAHGVLDSTLIGMGAQMFNKSMLPIPHMEQALHVDFALKNQFLILDLAALISVDQFSGVPSSSLTTSVCFWRQAMGRPSNAMCDILALRTFSPRCTETHHQCAGK